MFIAEYEKGNVYLSKKHINKIFELLENDDDEAIQRLIDEGKAERHNSQEFTDNFIQDLRSDLEILQQVKSLWKRVDRDPKLLALLKKLETNKLLKENKLILFTESKETAEYLAKNVNKAHPTAALCFTGGSGEATRQVVIQNFDAKARRQKNDYRILISTEVLSEGVNLHRSNVVINYDIPWNPTRLMQRVGRINRVDTKFDTIHTFTFFPTIQSDTQIKLTEAAVAKIHAFLTLLGGDAALLTEGEPVGSHELFNRLVSKKTVTGEDENETSELKYLTLIKDIRDTDPDLFEKIKLLPKKARSGKISERNANSLVTYFRRDKAQKFFLSGRDIETVELDFLSAAETLESTLEEKRRKLPDGYFELLDKNKEAFINATTEDMLEVQTRRGRDSAYQILKILKAVFKNTQQLTDDQELYAQTVMARLEEGGLPKQTTKTALNALNELGNQMTSPLKVLAVLQTAIPARLLESHYAEQNPRSTGKREVILSMYLA